MSDFLEGKDETSVVFNEIQKNKQLFLRNGCKKLHIVDLDAAFGRPDINLLQLKKLEIQYQFQFN